MNATAVRTATPGKPSRREIVPVDVFLASPDDPLPRRRRPPVSRLDRLRTRQRRERQGALWATAVFAVLSLISGIVTRGGTAPAVEAAPATSAGADPADATARRFLDRYVEPDGRVVRHDQDGDTVSEGQAYAMLLAVAVDDRETFDRVWSWTREQLQREDGLLSWHWRDGAVSDPESAADADVDAAHALLLAADRFAEPSYRADGVRLAQAVRDFEVRDVGDRPVLMAGSWTLAGAPVVNPSYFNPVGFQVLGEATGDPRWWDALTDSGYEVVEDLRAEGGVLPPDWAQLRSSGSVQAISGLGDVGGRVRYSFDAARLPVRFAIACDPQGQALAASMWPVFATLPPGQIRDAYDLSGTPTGGGRSPVTVVGAAAAAHAAGDEEAVARLLDAADQLDAEAPSYYGAAWAALGRVLLTSDRLGSC